MKPPASASPRRDAARTPLVPTDSPALQEGKPGYPAAWGARVPLRVRATRQVVGIPFLTSAATQPGQEYPVWVNSYGAVAAIMEDGRTLGLKPDEFEVTAWHDAPAASPPADGIDVR